MATLKFTIDAGRVIRDQVRWQLEKYCWRHDLHIQFVEDRRPWSSNFLVTISGGAPEVEQARRDTKAWITILEGEKA